MWKYTWQIRTRWIMFILTVTGVVWAIYQSLQNFPNLSLKMSVEAAITNLSVAIEFVPIWGWPIILGVAILLLVVGFPSAFLFGICYVLSNFWIAIMISIFAQTIASLVTIALVRKFGWSIDLPKRVETMIVSSEVLVGDFTFWGRIFISYPQRTLDVVTAKLMHDEMKFTRLIFQIIPAIALRIVVPSLWIVACVNFVYRITPFPRQAATNFLFASSFLIILVLFPKIPELMPCPSNVKSLLKVVTSSKDEEDVIVEDTAKNGSDNVEITNTQKPVEKAVDAIVKNSQT